MASIHSSGFSYTYGRAVYICTMNGLVLAQLYKDILDKKLKAKVIDRNPDHIVIETYETRGYWIFKSYFAHKHYIFENGSVIDLRILPR